MEGVSEKKRKRKEGREKRKNLYCRKYVGKANLNFEFYDIISDTNFFMQVELF
jgi:hypothetical protein